MPSPIIQEIELDALMPLIQEQLSAGRSVRFSPRGISMLPMLRQGKDSVLLSPVPPQLKKYDLPLYRRDNGKYILHRIVHAGESYTCVGDNQFDLETGVRRDQMLAVVTEFYRNGKPHSVQSFSHKLYCRFWHYSRPFRHLWRRGIGFIRRKIK